MAKKIGEVWLFAGLLVCIYFTVPSNGKLPAVQFSYFLNIGVEITFDLRMFFVLNTLEADDDKIMIGAWFHQQ